MVKDELPCNIAAQIVTEQGFQVFQGPNRILLENHKIGYIKKQDPQIVAWEEDLRSPQMIVKIKNYEELKRLGVKIVQRYRKNKKYFGRYQAYEYMLVLENRTVDEVGTIPKDHIIEHDYPHFRVRMLGPHAMDHGSIYQENGRAVGVTQWLHYKVEQEHGEDKNDPNYILRKAEELRLSRIPIELQEKAIVEVKIPEIIVCQDPEDHSLYCIEEKADEPVIAITGKRGSGKTTLFNRLQAEFYHHWRKNVIILNDRSGECEDWCLPWGERSYDEQVLELVNEHSEPLPAVYLHLEGNPPLKEILHEGGVGFKISMPSKDFFMDYETVFKTKKSWDMKKIMPRLRNIFFDEYGNPKEEFFQCQGFAEIEEYVQNEMVSQLPPGVGPKSISGMLEKLNAVLKDIDHMNFMDISNKINAYWDIRSERGEKRLFPWMAACYMGIVPIFETKYFKDTDYFPIVMKFIVQTVFDYQAGKRDPYFYDHKSQVILAVDELPEIANAKNKTVANPIFESIATVGRMNRIGLLYATQDYLYTPKRIISNTDYLFCLLQGDDDNAKEIVKDFGLKPAKDWVEEMLNLKESEVIMMCKPDHKIIQYDVRGVRREVEGPVFGMLLPTLNRRTPPRTQTVKPDDNA